ncbi:hypothetical protein B9G53_21640 [Pseudanabaena sp. SR411]|uniref:hypothetical protein n=1 Tax=Pseudanabaena sp. SR411 TaxID=1980935 RepID=UPI000B990686|nr:hypothetical protein [Pseudanabaena sp. SR411]OYQ62582.1 hypothetical protein B9G53_21640 [Pseudanabaena sp. SR411]
MKKVPFFKHRLFLLGVSLSLYTMGLTFPALAFEIVNYKTSYSGIMVNMRGIEVTAWGILGLLFLQIPAIGWLANPLYWLSCVLFVKKKYQFSIAAALTAIIVGFIGTISAYWFALPNGSSPDSHILLTKLLLGFWLWLAAPIFLMIIDFVYLQSRGRSNAQK